MQGGVKASLACASGVPTVVGMDGPWRIEYYVDEHGRDPFRRWVDGLPPSAARVVIDEIELRSDGRLATLPWSETPPEIPAEHAHRDHRRSNRPGMHSTIATRSVALGRSPG